MEVLVVAVAMAVITRLRARTQRLEATAEDATPADVTRFVPHVGAPVATITMSELTEDGQDAVIEIDRPNAPVAVALHRLTSRMRWVDQRDMRGWEIAEVVGLADGVKVVLANGVQRLFIYATAMSYTVPAMA